MKNLVYLALDSERFVKETLTSVYSFARLKDDETEQYRIVIYTNMPEAFTDAARLMPSVVIKEVDDELRQRWLGCNKYIYRSKMCALLDCVETFFEPSMLCMRLYRRAPGTRHPLKTAGSL